MKMGHITYLFIIKGFPIVYDTQSRKGYPRVHSSVKMWGMNLFYYVCSDSAAKSLLISFLHSPKKRKPVKSLPGAGIKKPAIRQMPDDRCKNVLCPEAEKLCWKKTAGQAFLT